MKQLFFLLTLFCLVSCLNSGQNTSSLVEAEVKLYNEWLYSYKLENFKFNGIEFTRPPGISQLVFSLTIPIDGGTALKTHCLYYQVPYKKIPGELIVTELINEATCPEAAGENPWLQVSGIEKLTIKLENYKLSFNFEKSKKKVSWEFLLPNLEDGIYHEKYQPVKDKKLYSGLSFLRINDESFLNQQNRYLGKLSDKMSNGSSIRCLQIDKNCNTVGENRCDECRYGWYQVVDYNCPQGGSKFCGQNHCGEKNEAACPRGTKVVGGIDAGICQSDLTPVANADHILICQ
jgi:hypothetical protein